MRCSNSDSSMVILKNKGSSRMNYPIDRIASSPRPAADETGPRAKPSKACVVCRARKVKCDATIVGLPCNSCISRQCPESCVLLARKRRKRTVRNLPTAGESGRSRGVASPSTRTQHHETDRRPPHHLDGSHNDATAESSSSRQPSRDPRDSEGPYQPQPDLHYLNILQDAINDTESTQQLRTAGSPSFDSRRQDGLTQHIRLWYKPPQLDGVDNEYLAKKEVFELPPQRYLDTLLETFFEYVYPFVPVVDRMTFIRRYRSNDCSLFLLYSMLAVAALYAPENSISGCGFQGRSAAQVSFFSKARLLHDFDCEKDPLSMLQGSLILGGVILEHQTDRDFQYWFHNATRLAVKLDIHNICTREDKSFKFFKLYRRIWWVLYNRDVFHSFVNTRNLRLLDTLPHIKLITIDDWEAEDTSEGLELLSPISHRQKTLLIAHCELAQIFGQCLSSVTNEPEQDPHPLMRPLDTWRMSLAEKMGIRNPSYDGDIFYLEVLATSYRFESIMCRLLRRRRWPSWDISRGEWARPRLRSAILELECIARRLLTNYTTQKLPMSFVTTMPALLALHIETALDPSETEFIRSMARISISQTMLVLRQLQEIPAIKRGLPAFELVLSKKNLYPVPVNNTDHIQPPSPRNSLDEAPLSSLHTRSSVVTSEVGSGYTSLLEDCAGFDFLDHWQIDQLDFTDLY